MELYFLAPNHQHILLFSFLLLMISPNVKCNSKQQDVVAYDIEDCSRLQQHLSESDVSQTVFSKNQRYSYWDRPVVNASKSVEVSLKLFLRTIAEINERSQEVKLKGFLKINWFDEFHVWNETWPLYCIDCIVLPHGEPSGIWLPDVAFTSSADKKYDLTRSPLEFVRVRSDGYVNFAPGSIFEFTCEFNLALFPFDVQVCTMTFESWCYQTKYQYFAEPEVILDEHHKSLNEEWEMFGGKAIHKIGNYTTGEFDWVEFEISLRRKAGYYALTIILPCLLIAAVEVVTFAIPFHKAVRLEVSFTCLLAYSVFQSLMTSEMPHSADHPPLLLILISLLTVYIGLAIYFQSICIVLSCKAERSDNVWRWLLLIADCLAPLVGLPHLAVQFENRRGLLIRIHKPPGSAPWTKSDAWYYIARVADRYSLLCFLFLLVSTSFALLVVIPFTSPLSYLTHDVHYETERPQDDV